MHNTPNIELDSELQRLSISGDSYPEQAADFYAPMFSWLEHHLASDTQSPLTVHIELKRFNSSSAKVLMDLFDRLEASARKGRPVVIEWCFDHNNLLSMQSGHEFAAAWPELKFDLCTLSHPG